MPDDSSTADPGASRVVHVTKDDLRTVRHGHREVLLTATSDDGTTRLTFALSPGGWRGVRSGVRKSKEYYGVAVPSGDVVGEMPIGDAPPPSQPRRRLTRGRVLRRAATATRTGSGPALGGGER